MAKKATKKSSRSISSSKASSSRKSDNTGLDIHSLTKSIFKSAKDTYARSPTTNSSVGASPSAARTEVLRKMKEKKSPPDSEGSISDDSKSDSETCDGSEIRTDSTALPPIESLKRKRGNTQNSTEKGKKVCTGHAYCV